MNAGDVIEGELASASPFNLNDGTRYSAHWLCGEGEADGYRYTLEAPCAASLAAFDDQGQWLGATQGSPDGRPATLLDAPEAGQCTLIMVSGRSVDAFGPYRLEGESVGDTTALEPGRPVVGQWDGPMLSLRGNGVDISDDDSGGRSQRLDQHRARVW